MLSVFQLGRLVSPFKIVDTLEIGGFRILRRSAKCRPRPRAKRHEPLQLHRAEKVLGCLFLRDCTGPTSLGAPFKDAAKSIGDAA